MNRPSIPPPAGNLVVLAGDLLAVAAKRITVELACAPSWEPMQRLKQALDAYEHARIGDAVTNPDVQAPSITVWDEPAPETQRSVHHG